MGKFHESLKVKKTAKTIFFIRFHFENEMSSHIQINIIIIIFAFEIDIFGDIVIKTGFSALGLPLFSAMKTLNFVEATPICATRIR